MVQKDKKGTSFQSKLNGWIKEKERQTQNLSSTTQFLAHKADIEEALNDGHSKKTIWDFLTEQKMIETTYNTFCRHCRKYIDVNVKKEDSKTEETTLAAKKTGDRSGFEFNPKADKGDLI